jgi:hypothetical protein
MLIVAIILLSRERVKDYESGKSCGPDLSGLLPNLTGLVVKEEIQFECEKPPTHYLYHSPITDYFLIGHVRNSLLSLIKI